MSKLLDLYVVTFNCSREFVDLDAFSFQILSPYRHRDRLPDIVVLCLEEVAPLAYSFLGGSFVRPYLRRIISAVKLAAAAHSDEAFRPIYIHSAGLTGLIVLVKEDLVPQITRIESAEVGVGRSETGNKGAVGARLVYRFLDGDDPVSLIFVAAHLYPFESGVKQRNLDWKNIVRGLVFTAITGKTVNATVQPPQELGDDENSQLLGQDHVSISATSEGPVGIFRKDSLLFFAGDLNYRTSETEPEPEAFSNFPQPTADKTDPRHYSHLLSLDQLSRERREGRTLHGLAEAEIDFPPTYKYSSKQQKVAAVTAKKDIMEPTQWHWSQHRWPSWCDRVLFSSVLSSSNSPLHIISYQSLACQPTSDHRPVSLACQLDLKSVTTSQLKSSSAHLQSPFELNQRWAEDRAAARVKEVVIGTLTYLAWTWEGHGLLLATTIGAVGGWFIMQYLVTS